jgi:acyl-CoA synthetase (AMP-forming)/AMP-acid ligase II
MRRSCEIDYMASETSGGGTLSGLLHAQAAQRGDAPAILAPGRPPLTYAGLWRQAQRVARVLKACGARPGTRVAITLPNGPELASALLGAAASVSCVPLNPASPSAEFVTFLTDAGVELVITLCTERGPVRTAAEELGVRVVDIERDASLPAGEFHIDAGAGDDFEMEPRGRPHEHALVLHTSGTTARPKIVPLSHANVMASARAIAAHLALDANDRCLNVMPLFHVHGIVGALLATVAAGASVVCTGGFDHRGFFEWIAEFDPTWYSAVPTIHQWVVANGGLYRRVAPAHRFRFVRSCSAALPSKTFEALQALTGAPVVEAYGMTEASHQIASNPLRGPRKAGSVGLPAGAEVRLIDERGAFVDNGASGEIVVRGPGVMRGYESDPAANAKSFVDGWFRTGDQGRFDDEGYLYLVGRLKDVINRGGEKISPSEIDAALLQHEDVVEAVAFGMPHPTLGQDVAAAAVLRRGAAVDERALRCFLLERLAQSKVPSRVVVVNAIPKEATGKIQRAGMFDKLRNVIGQAVRAPRTETEKSLAAIFRSVLECGEVGAHDNFFALGGDSLKAAQVLSRILAQHGVELAVPALFVNATIAELARAVDEARAAAEARRQALCAEIEQMSDEEVARLLAEEERSNPTSWT